MTGFEVLIRKPTSSANVAVGRVISSPAQTLKVVDWGDGNPVEVKLGPEFAPARAGSVRYLQYTRPDMLKELLTNDPKRLFVLVLAELRKATTAKDLITAVASHDLDRGRVSAVWKKIGPTFHELSGVERSHAKTPTYKWSRSEIPYVAVENLVPETPLSMPSISAAEVKLESIDDSSQDPPIERDVPDQQAPIRDMGTGNLPKAMERFLQEPSEVSRGEIRSAMSGEVGVGTKLLLSTLLGEDLNIADADSSELAERPIRVAIDIPPLNTTIINGLLAKSPEPRETLWPVLLAHSGAARSQLKDDPSFRDWLQSPAFAKTTSAMMREVNTAAPDSLLAERLIGAMNLALASSKNLGALSDPALAEMLDGISAVESRESDQLRSSLAKVLVERWKQEPLSGLQRAELELFHARLARGIRPMPFEGRGGRSSLTAAVFRRDPKEASKARWWVGFDFAALADVGDGVLSQALNSDEILRSVVVPVVERELDAATTRRGLMNILAASSTVAGVVTGERVDKKLREIASVDSRVDSWRQALRQAAYVEQLEVKLREAESDAARARTSEAEARDREVGLQGANDLLTSKLAQASTAHSGIRNQELRQAQIDAVRALAQAASLVESEISKLESQEMVTRLQSFLARQGVEKIGSAGSVEPFDPERHDAPGARPDVGEPAHVVRSGYNWRTPEEEVLLMKARVVKPEGE
ncbi:nucleotide exchange factor GrpE [Homoserinimonas sp. A447]